MPQSKPIYILSDKKVEGTINLPVIEIAYIKQPIDLENYDALIFTSKNAVKAMDSMDESWKNIPSYVIAPQTAKILKSLGGNLVFTGKQNHGNEFAQEIHNELQGKKVLYIRGVKMVSNILEILSSKNVNCDSLIVYDTVCKIYEEEVILPKSSIIIFSAPSTIECFLKNITWDESFRAICIGKTTAKYFPEYIKPIVSDTTSIVSCVQKAQELS
jgi:uroporphyrinogen-III synthase